MDGATIEPLAPLLLLLNDQTTTQNTEIEVNTKMIQVADQKCHLNKPIKRQKKKGLGL